MTHLGDAEGLDPSEVVLTGDRRNGTPMPLSAFTEISPGEWVISDQRGTYRHVESDLNCWRQGMRLALFESN
jgi:hypothetical protein